MKGAMVPEQRQDADRLQASSSVLTPAEVQTVRTRLYLSRG